MNKLAIFAATALLGANLLMAEEAVRLRYQESSGHLAVTATHDIRAGESGSTQAGRTFEFDFGLTSDSRSGALVVELKHAKGTYTAHDMTEHLPTTHLAGQGFRMTVESDGRSLSQAEPGSGPVVDLGWIVEGGFSIGLALVDIMPSLPEEPVAVGTTWATERTVKSLEGWSWATGQLHSRHQITGIDQHNGRTVVTVTSEGQGNFGPVDGVRAYDGDGEFTRKLRWSFDASAGKLITLSLEQESTGLNELPQGKVRVSQLTRIDLTASDDSLASR